MKFEQGYRKAYPETVGETDREFDVSNYVEWLESLVEEKFTSTNSAMDAICPACNNTGVVNHGVDGLSYCGCSAGERAKQHQ